MLEIRSMLQTCCLSGPLLLFCVFMFSLYILVSWEQNNFLYIFFLSASFKTFLMHFVFKSDPIVLLNNA